MRWMSLGTAVLLGFALSPLPGPAAHADPYKWCAVYNGRDNGATNCGFVTYKQCIDTVRGIGGWCEPNPFYDGRSFDGSEYRPPRRGYRQQQYR